MPTLFNDNLPFLTIFGLIALVVICTIAIIYSEKKEQAKKIILAFVLEAERIFGGKTGEAKFSYVAGLVYPALPLIVRTFISQDTLEKMIEDAVKEMNDWLLPKIQDALKK